MNKTIIFFLIIFISGPLFSQMQKVRVMDKQSKDDISHSYYINLLKMTLEATEKEYGKTEVELVDVEASQGRVFEHIKQNRTLDITWAGTNKEREELFLPIRIPLNAGLLGYRVPVILKKNLKQFDEVKNIEDLKKMKLIQGTHWPDSDILEHAGFTVLRYSKFKQMYDFLLADRVDFFPRGLNEVYAEVESIGRDKLVAYDRIIIKYLFPMYFFVNKNNFELAERVNKGLLIIIKNGSFSENLKKHPVTAPAFPLDKFENSLIFEIINPELPENTPLDEKSLWLQIP